MKKLFLPFLAVLLFTACQKQINNEQQVNKEQQEKKGAASMVGNAQKQAPDPYNLDVELYGQGNEKGDIKFRQDPDPAKIVTLNTKIQHLLPNHEYKLQRAVDVIIDGIVPAQHGLHSV